MTRPNLTAQYIDVTYVVVRGTALVESVAIIPELLLLLDAKTLHELVNQINLAAQNNYASCLQP